MNALASFSWVQPRLGFLGRDWSSFQVCGATGLVLGSCLAMALAGPAQVLRPVLGGLLVVAGLVFLALTLVTKVLTGRESLVYYHHEVAILTCCALMLKATGLPVLPYLDLTALGLGVFLACGRQGCLMVGCCHGKPHAWGVAYSESHAAEGFPAHYVGVRLFPVQVLESLVVIAIVLGCAVLVLKGQPPGTALSWYVASYSFGRIWLEELRGDGARPYWHRLSEAQWTSLLILTGIVASEGLGRLPLSAWHVAMLAGATLSLAALVGTRTRPRTLLQARHAGEVADIVRALPSAPGRVRVRQTSQAICLSTQALGMRSESRAVLVSMSRADGRMTFQEARALCCLIGCLVFSEGSRQRELLGSPSGVFHLILHDDAC